MQLLQDDSVGGSLKTVHVLPLLNHYTRSNPCTNVDAHRIGNSWGSYGRVLWFSGAGVGRGVGLGDVYGRSVRDPALWNPGEAELGRYTGQPQSLDWLKLKA